ncbi:MULTISPECIES: AbrB/MazE/SpoVT family DNA-binding domain-containing protein [Pectobacterium]|uniref:AbrB/MazE/SpoVT family DNA-binding domain-containing protein n=1 Tax=Pectobacterium TaxID=122277 RepID=UPI0005768DB5|nr:MULTISPECIES: PbsX family transcriptional regulator [Pectobacterium]PLY35661.1 PbsX family transcriptional regulator [Pectobacterium carotovorum]AVT59727.1 suppressor of growth inhibitory protein ChpA [Pectobacterium versatile]MBB1525585.1 PbsX family transcriptional regulator [Pectobacterium carotovorum subsp. carotovorum]MCH5052279.1 PbsX family transcriptional regulator [Pectobacterium aquaticum]QQG27016.1 PbsX family transcriptional regulator [Pectobacterium carotovorum]
MIDVPVKKWGNSPAIRLSSSVMQAFDMTFNDSFDMEIRETEIALIPKKKPKYQFTLDELLEGMTPEHVHEKVDFGAPVGKELL